MTPKRRLIPTKSIQRIGGEVGETNKRARQIVGGHMQSWGVAVTEAKSGPIALQMLEMCKADGVDALVIDAQLPGCDGFALAKGIRERPDFADMPILMKA